MSAVPQASNEKEPQFARGDLLADRFEIVRFIARGGMGEVYEARDHLLNNSTVALKTILGDRALEPGERERLKHEVTTSRAVTHPSICPIYDFYECQLPSNACFLTMKLIRGKSLAQRLAQENAFSINEAESIAHQVCGGLRAAHMAGIVHRDLKPGNIMLQDSSKELLAVVTDFGLALSYDTDETVSITKHIVGTRGYIAPEVIAGDPATPASDLYSLGVILHELFIGGKPQGGRVAATDAKKVPDRWLRLTTACLSIDPDLRIQEFQRFFSPAAVTASRQTASRINRRTILKWGAVAVAAATGAETYLKWEDIWHPLPQKRFVAVIQFPPISDPSVMPLLQGVIEAIEINLSRAEAYDRNLFVTAVSSISGTGAEALRAIRDSYGANLVLATQGSLAADILHLGINILDSTNTGVIRSRKLKLPQSQVELTRRRAVDAAAEMLNVSLREKQVSHPSLATSSQEAYQLFESGESARQQPNDSGLESAINDYTAALLKDPNYAIAYAKLSMAYTRLFFIRRDEGALELAGRNARAAIRLDSNLIEGHVAESSYHDAKGDKQKALEEIKDALALDPANPATLYYQAQILYRWNRFEEAEQIYRRILEQRPNYWQPYNEFGCVLEQQGKFREALKVFRAEVLINPYQSLAFSNLGDALFNLGDLPEATINYKRALSLSRNNAYALAGMSATLRAQGDFKAALPYELEATEISPSDDENWLHLGDTYTSLRRINDARQAYARALQAVERSLLIDAADMAAWVRLALYLSKTDAPADALKTLEKGQPWTDLDLDHQVIRARVYSLLGDRERAVEILQKCFKKGLTKTAITFIPDFQGLKTEPRVQELLSEKR